MCKVSEGFVRLRDDLQGYARISKVSQGFVRIYKVSQEFVRFRKDLSGFARICKHVQEIVWIWHRSARVLKEPHCDTRICTGRFFWSMRAPHANGNCLFCPI
jgi:hypothetical protein